MELAILENRTDHFRNDKFWSPTVCNIVIVQAAGLAKL